MHVICSRHGQLGTSAKHPPAPNPPQQPEPKPPRPVRSSQPGPAPPDRDPKQIHHPGHKQHAHQSPATPQAIHPVPEPHAERAAHSIAPVRHQESERAPAMCQTSAFPRCELIGPCHNQNDAVQVSVGQSHCGRRQHGSLVQRPLSSSRKRAEHGPDCDIPKPERQRRDRQASLAAACPGSPEQHKHR